MPTILFEFAVLAFVSLFTMINPLGVVPVYVSMTSHLSAAEARRVAIKASLTAFLILVAFAIGGQFIFRFFSITVDSLRIVGGIIFFGIGYEMLQARLTRTQHDDENKQAYMNDIALTPLGIPMICGPGAITSVILLMSGAPDFGHRAALFAALTLVMLLTLLVLLGAQRILAFMGENGNKVLLRLMGLIVMVIAVEFFFSGLTPFVQRMLVVR